jgi:hypothetical protein
VQVRPVKVLLPLLGSGVLIPIVGATVRHYWSRHLRRREEARRG